MGTSILAFSCYDCAERTEVVNNPQRAKAFACPQPLDGFESRFQDHSQGQFADR
jgi:hypothetical protein